MGRIISVEDDDWLLVVQNLVKARMVWWRFLTILSREGRGHGYLDFYSRPS